MSVKGSHVLPRYTGSRPRGWDSTQNCDQVLDKLVDDLMIGKVNRLETMVVTSFAEICVKVTLMHLVPKVRNSRLSFREQK